MVRKKPAKPVERNIAALQEKVPSQGTAKTSRGGKKNKKRRNPMSSNLATSTTSTSNLDSWRAALSQVTAPGLLGLQPRFAMPSTSTTTVASQNFGNAEGGTSSVPFPNLPSRLDSQASSLPLDLPSSADFSINPAAWPYRWTNMKDIMDDDIMSYLRKHWTTQMVVSAVIPNRKTTLDSSLFMDTLKSHPWQDSADLIFHCNGSRPVKIHSVLLGAVLPELVENLSKFKTMHLNNGPTSTNVIIKTPVFLRGVEPDTMEGFLGLCGKGIASMTGKNVSGVKVIMEALNIEEMSVYVHLGNFTSLSQSQSVTETNDPVDTSANEIMTDARSPLNLRRIAAVPSGISIERSRQTRQDSQTTEELGERNEQSETGRKKLSLQEALDEISKSVSSEAGVAGESSLAVQSSSTTSTSGRAKRRSGRFSNPTTATPNRRSNRLKNLNTVSQVDVDECTEWVAKQSGQNPEVLEGTAAAEDEGDQSLENFRTVKTVYPEEVRLNVLDALHRGQSVSELSNYYSASLPLINRWKYAADISKKKAESSVEAPSAESTSANEWNISVQAGNSGGRNNDHQIQGPSVQGQGAASSSSALPLQTPSTAPDTSIYFGTNANAQAAHSAIAILRNSLNGNRDTQLTQPSFSGTENCKPGNENDGVRDFSTNRSMPSDSSTGNYDTRMNPHGFQ